MDGLISLALIQYDLDRTPHMSSVDDAYKHQLSSVNLLWFRTY